MTKQDYKNVMLTYLNRPYKWGGDDPMSGLDCSGLAQELLAALGKDPPGDQTAHALWEHCKAKGKALVYPETGDLVFYGTQFKMIHVATGFENGIVIEAGGGGSKTNTLEDAIRQNAFIRLRPYNHRADLHSIWRLNLGLIG